MTLSICDWSDGDLEEIDIQVGADLQADLAAIPGEVHHYPYLGQEVHF
jgi:hypothetical protein